MRDRERLDVFRRRNKVTAGFYPDPNTAASEIQVGWRACQDAAKVFMTDMAAFLPNVTNARQMLLAIRTSFDCVKNALDQASGIRLAATGLAARVAIASAGLATMVYGSILYLDGIGD